MFTFLGRMQKLTRDAAFVQVLYLANDRAVAGLPHDVFAADPAAFHTRVAQAIAEQREEPKHESVNKQQWRIALLKSGAGADSRVAWLNYEAGGGHGHRDGMNLGLFAFGLDLVPDFVVFDYRLQKSRLPHFHKSPIRQVRGIQGTWHLFVRYDVPLGNRGLSPWNGNVDARTLSSSSRVP